MKAIAAMARNRVIGNGSKIPWHLPEDFRWFKQTTLGGTVVMGRRTWESLGKPLPNRRNVVVSRSLVLGEGQGDNVEVVPSIAAVLERFGSEANVWVIGGAEIYAQLLPYCSDLYLSLVAQDPVGDVFFPAFEEQFERVETVKEFPEFSVIHYRKREGENYELRITNYE